MVVMMALTRVDVMQMLSSRIFYSKKQGDPFYAPFSEHAMRSIRMFGLVGMLLEDTPQFVLQMVSSIFFMVL